MMDKRSFIRAVSAALAAAALPRLALAADAVAGKPTRLLAGWRSAEKLPAAIAGGLHDYAEGPGDYIGVVEIDWASREVRLQSAIAVASRGHGLIQDAQGGYIAQAYRHGLWVLRADAAGKAVRQVDIKAASGRVSGGHVALSADGKQIFCTEIEPVSGEGWVCVRDALSLKALAQWPTQGMDPHKLLQDEQGMLLIANGGIRYTDKGAKRDIAQMASSLVRLNPATGALLGQWRLRDTRLSMRHLAWNTTAAGETLLGIAMQGEHDDPDARKNAPTLAVWNGKELRIPSQSPLAEGYTGDIMAGPGGGFILSAQLSGKALLWHPGDAGRLHLIGDLSRACALAGPDDEGGFLISGEKGPARWHLRESAQMLAWPIPMSPDNHWVLLEA